MYDFYGVYASCRDAAWRCLIDFDVRSLPVKITDATTRAGIRVSKNSDARELRTDELGASIYLPDGQWLIVYDDRLPPERSRMVIAHEFGHILLGHEYKYRDCRFDSGAGKLKSEREADMFAVRILAPACVLHELQISDTKNISEACWIPRKIAAERAKRMKILEKRDSFYKSELEKEVGGKFSKYVSSHRNKK